MGVRVLSVSRVAPSQQQGGRVKLSLLDISWFWLPQQLLFLYEYDLGDAAGFPAMVSRLKAALADTLTQYLPLAGRLEYEAETGDIVIDCSDAGVAFVEAETDGSMDVRRLAYDEAHDMPAFVSLVPELDARVLPAPVLSVQVTRLGACGLAVGVTWNHAVADGRATFLFLEAWASTSREGSSALGPPMYCRDAIHYPRDDELARQWLKIIAPNLPVVSLEERNQATSPLLRLARRTFRLGANSTRSLKRRIDSLATAAGAPKPWKPVSTFVALAALAWTAFVRSKGIGTGDDTYLIFSADMRGRLHLPVTNAYLGNCIRVCIAGCANAGEIAGEEAGIVHAARAVQAAVAEMEEALLVGYYEVLSDKMMRLPFSRVTSVVGSQWFQAYGGNDFGFGKPALAEVVSMDQDGVMMLLGGRRDGEVQVSVSIHPAHMATYKACIRGYLPTLSRI